VGPRELLLGHKCSFFGTEKAAALPSCQRIPPRGAPDKQPWTRNGGGGKRDRSGPKQCSWPNTGIMRSITARMLRSALSHRSTANPATFSKSADCILGPPQKQSQNGCSG
jgi:hypothetical protein